jgi:hypothetical protein
MRSFAAAPMITNAHPVISYVNLLAENFNHPDMTAPLFRTIPI